MFTDFYDWRLENSNWPRIRSTSEEFAEVEFSVQGNFWEWKKPSHVSFIIINSLVFSLMQNHQRKFILQRGTTAHCEQLIKQFADKAPIVFVNDMTFLDYRGGPQYYHGEFRNNAYYERREVIYNPNLSSLVGKELYEFTDEIAQEVDLWLGSRAETKPEPVSDKLKIKAHGFDNTRSFRNC